MTAVSDEVRTADGIAVVLIDPLDLSRAALAEALGETSGIRVVAAASTADELLIAGADVAVVVGQIHRSGIDEVQALRAFQPSLRILLVGPSADQVLLSNAIAEGVDGYLTAGDDIGDLVRGIQLLRDGAAVIPPHMLGHLLRDLVQRNARADEATRLFARLTPREREVLGLLVDGCNHDGVAARLVISPETAKTHIQNVITKLGVHSRLAAAALAVEYGLVQPRP